MAVWQAVEEHFHDIARLIVINLCVFALPTIVLYLLGVGAAALVARKSD